MQADDRDARIAPTPERLRYHARRFLQADGSPTFMSDWLGECAARIADLEAALAQMRTEWGTLFKISGETLVQVDKLLDARAGQGQRKGAGDA